MKIKLTLLFLLGALALMLAGCSPEEAPPQAVTQEGSQAAAAPSRPDEPAAGTVERGTQPARERDYCLECHTDPQKLEQTASQDEAPSLTGAIAGRLGEPVRMEAWEKVLVDGENFPGSIHGLNGCVNCHGGVQAADKDTAHAGVIANPSADAGALCGECHPNVVTHAGSSLHANLTGFTTALEQRSFPLDHPQIEGILQENCSTCHATCGECHVSQPKAAGGGFIDNHLFQREPPMEATCTVCHGATVGDEFLGNHRGLAGDLHYVEGDMTCTSCHTRAEMHGETANCQSCHPGPDESQLPPPGHRYDGIQTPSCESCHPRVAAGQDEIIMHQMHGSKLSCQVCHSVEYTNCQGCHASEAPGGEVEFELEDSFFSFLIGRNPNQSYERPYEYVLLRHVPVTPDTFALFGDDLLGAFDRVETWKYTTPHNIQRRTPQTESCNNCHGNPDLFLTADKVAPEELEANAPVIVDGPPPPITSADQLPYR